jgi:selenide,water dikinase
VLADLPYQSDPNLIAGMEQAEDAGIYKLTDDLAIMQTVDFFTPIVDDPYDFGRIAVANSLSDVYAMGGRPLTALNVVCFPEGTMDFSILREVLRGGLDTMREAEVILLGGHTVDDPELKYGLAVTGTIHPDKVVHNTGAKPGEAVIARIVKSMAALNRAASEAMLAVGVNACKDVTGFGLLGHTAEMIEGNNVGMIIKAAAVPYFPEAKEYAEMGMIPAGLHHNREFRRNMVDIDSSVPQYLQDVLFDPQTSGGLLIAVPKARAARLLKKLHAAGVTEATIIGEVVAEPKGRIKVI